MTAPFRTLPDGESVFFDANTLIYHFGGDPQHGPACKALLDRVEQQRLAGHTSAHVLAEVAHRLMVIEACGKFGWPTQGATARLRRRPAEVQQLALYRRSLDEITLIGLAVHSLTAQLVSVAADRTKQYGLLTNDALIVVVMEQHKLTNLASNDADFDRVPGLTRYAPA
jgi:predicted nucleic acid-binding protein